MWLLIDLIAVVVIFLNLFLYITGKDYKLAMAIGLSFTALTLWTEYSLVSEWIKTKIGQLNGKYPILRRCYGF